MKSFENSPSDGLDVDSLDPEVPEIDPDRLDSGVLSEFDLMGRNFLDLLGSSPP